MSNFNAEVHETLTRAEAIVRITHMARQGGFKGGFKVIYAGQRIDTPDMLPDTVDMSQVSLGHIYDQAV